MTRQSYTSSRSLRSHSSSLPRSGSAQAYRERRFPKSADDPVDVPPPTVKPHSHVGIGLAAIAVVAGLFGVVALRNHPVLVQKLLSASFTAKMPPIAPPIRTKLTPEAVYSKVSAAVVTIDTPKRSSGSGVLINRSGMLLTNEHVVEQFPIVQVTLFNRQSMRGRVIQVDKVNDLAVVQIDSPTPSSCLPIDAAELSIGQVVYALGSPLRMEQTFTNGVVSRHSETGEILHTAAIAPGSSGSPLFNDQGQIVGINRAVLTRFQAMSIAVPTRVIRQLGITFNCDA